MAGFNWNEFYTVFKIKLEKETVAQKNKVGRYTTAKPSTFPYTDVTIGDISGDNYDLQGHQGSKNPLIVISVYCTGSLADSTCEQISTIAEELMESYGFQCRGGPMPMTNAADPSIARWVSRYQRIFGIGDELKQLH